MSKKFNASTKQSNSNALVGVGLRHQHYEDVLRPQSNSKQQVDFVEVHAENFYAEGGPALSILEQVAEKYAVSIHATSLGLGSTVEIPQKAIDAFKRLVDRINPVLVSDHACFTWGEIESMQVHAGDLLPIVLNQKTLARFIENVDRVQQSLGRQLLIENLSSYIKLPGHTMQELDFLQSVCHQTGSGLLVDINNLYVNALNDQKVSPLEHVVSILNSVEAEYVGEMHLAGFTPTLDGQLVIDDHSRPVSQDVWSAYQYALSRFGRIPTLIEWDNDLPSWNKLTAEALKARQCAKEFERFVA